MLAGCSGGTAAILESVDAGIVGADTLSTDASGSVTLTDVGIDAANVPMDGGIDVSTDTAMDAPVESAMDALVDTSVDVPFRCMTAADCMGSPMGPACDTTTGRCVGCVTTPDSCATSQHCDPASQSCVAGCRTDDGCTGASADGGTPVDASDGGALALVCDTSTHACVQCLTDAQCPAGLVCAGELCVPGCNSGHACPTALACCAGACVDEVTNAGNCGTCGAVCSVPNATATCMNSHCAVGTCMAPFADCNNLPADGCEVNILVDLNHCGSCGTVCAARPNTVAACTTGSCLYTCVPGFADCNGNPVDGCETSTATDVSHCGGCGTACALPSAVASCVSGACAVTSCAAGHGDCDGVPANGCEVDLTTAVDHCGTCTHTCTAGANAVAVCSAGACATTCVMGFQDCNGLSADGCEVDIRSSVANCGACGHDCALADVATDGCAGGSCTVLGCQPGYADCDHVAANGCEANLATDPSNCGGCGVHPTQTCDLADDNCSGRCEGVSGCRSAVLRSVNTSTGEHFYTTSPAEAVSSGFTLESSAAYYVHNASVAGTVPWYRCLMEYGKHLYTTSSICEGLVPGTVEGIMGYVSTVPLCGSVPLYRSYNPGSNDHFFTTSYTEHVSSFSVGYTDEGIGAYVWSAPSG